MEEKYGKQNANGNIARSEGDSDSSDEDEDEGDLATEEVDDAISRTLQAIRAKDPRVYDKNHTFYQQQVNARNAPREAPKSKAVNLQEYHRNNLLNGVKEEDEKEPPLRTYAEEQDALRSDMVKQMHGAADDVASDDSEAGDDFLKAKARPAEKPSQLELPSVSNADEDPEGFLSSLMASRAWVPKDRTQLHPFESDDEEEDDRADEFEHAYNMRFEDPERANETLKSHSRKAAEEYSVRREEPKGRKKAREIEKSRRDAERQEREEEKARLRNLRIEHAHQKLQQLKEAAGMKDADIPVEEWSNFLEAAFDSDKWDEEFQKRFGDKYYSQKDILPAKNGLDIDEDDIKKPKWDDDIDIGDIVPDFQEDEDAEFSLSDDDNAPMDGVANDDMDNDIDDAKESVPRKGEAGSKRKRDEERSERKRRARKEHRKIEEMVDNDLTTDLLPANGSSKRPDGPFRYRATSPTSFGLNARDILFADDRDLNQHHGLKKLAAFRDRQRKEKDRRRLDKKKLQKWRKETFGDRHGPSSTFQDYVKAKLDPASAANVPTREVPVKGEEERPKKKRKRSRKSKGEVSNAAVAT